MNGGDEYERNASPDMRMFMRWTRTFEKQMDERAQSFGKTVADLRIDLRERIDQNAKASELGMTDFRERLEKQEASTLALTLKNAGRPDLAWLYRGLAILVAGAFLAAIGSLFRLSVSQQVNSAPPNTPAITQGRSQ